MYQEPVMGQPIVSPRNDHKGWLSVERDTDQLGQTQELVQADVAHAGSDNPLRLSRQAHAIEPVAHDLSAILVEPVVTFEISELRSSEGTTLDRQPPKGARPQGIVATSSTEFMVADGDSAMFGERDELVEENRVFGAARYRTVNRQGNGYDMGLVSGTATTLSRESRHAGERVEPGQAFHHLRQAQDVRSAPRDERSALARPRLLRAGPPSVAVGNQASPLSPPALLGRLSWDPALFWLVVMLMIGVIGGMGFSYLTSVVH